MRTMKLVLAPAAIMILLAGCATRPDKIAATDYPDAAYTSLDCRALASEKAKRDRELYQLAQKQNDAANGDAFGVFLIGVPLSSLAGDDKKTEIATVKGKLAAITRVGKAKGCAL